MPIEIKKEKPHVAVVADIYNDTVPESLLAHFAYAKNFDIVTYPLLGEKTAANDIAVQMQANCPVVIAAVGISAGNHSEYQSHVHSLLDAWWQTDTKPVIMILSHTPEETRKHTESWPLWNLVPAKMSRTMITKFFPTVAQLQECLSLADELKSLRLQFAAKPDVHVTNLDVETGKKPEFQF